MQLKDDAVALVDILAPTDFILNSPIGQADGQVNALAQHKLAVTSETVDSSELSSNWL